jgi:hypothetical protein
MNRAPYNDQYPSQHSNPIVPAHFESLKNMEAYLRVIAPFDRVMIRVSKAGS